MRRARVVRPVSLRELMQGDPELQIVCTTHSAYLLDLFEPSEVRVLDIDADRSTHARPLTAHPEFETWKFGTQTGELWAAMGDAWVTKPEPEPEPLRQRGPSNGVVDFLDEVKERLSPLMSHRPD